MLRWALPLISGALGMDPAFSQRPWPHALRRDGPQDTQKEQRPASNQVALLACAKETSQPGTRQARPPCPWPRPRPRAPGPATPPVAPPPAPVAPPRTSAAGSAAPATSPRPRSCGSTPSTWSTPPTSRRWRPRRPPGCWMWGCCPRRQAPRMVRRLGPRQAGHPGQNSHRPGHSDVSEGHGGDSQGLKGT